MSVCVSEWYTNYCNSRRRRRHRRCFTVLACSDFHPLFFWLCPDSSACTTRGRARPNSSTLQLPNEADNYIGAWPVTSSHRCISLTDSSSGLVSKLRRRRRRQPLFSSGGGSLNDECIKLVTRTLLLRRD